MFQDEDGNGMKKLEDEQGEVAWLAYACSSKNNRFMQNLNIWRKGFIILCIRNLFSKKSILILRDKKLFYSSDSTDNVCDTSYNASENAPDATSDKASNEVV